jgi:Right handed beta helix region
MRRSRVCGALLWCMLAGACVSAPPAKVPRIFEVGPGQSFAKPSDVAMLVGPGDTVRIAAGTYADCARWPASAPDLKLVAASGTVTFQGKICADKAIFVIEGDNTLVRGITFKGARSKDHNGAGIRLESRKLTIEDSHFIDNEDGILTASAPEGGLIIRNSTFERNGACIGDCAHGIYVNHIAHLRIERSSFIGQLVGHHIKSRAQTTEIIGTVIRDGPEGTSSYLVDIPNGGNLFMSGDTLEKGPLSNNKTAAIEIGAEGVTNPTGRIRIENCHFVNDSGRRTAFVTNYTAASVELDGNAFEGDVTPISSAGGV